ncbi:MAG: 1-aminocyclopropane-1-carboxylate deaminase [Spirochaetia bacterium]|nr:1-aminocyclopropane-1-carboxylate deaminase [Spirochaetia bacterium]
MNFSPIQKISYLNRYFFVKRDDLIHPFLNGNKARKLFFLAHHNPLDYDELISCGGAQSNSMYALSSLAKTKNWKFTYFTRRIPPFLKTQPAGNFLFALENGMHLCELDHAEYDDFCRKNNKTSFLNRTITIPMGGQCLEAEEGMNLLAEELQSQTREMNISSFDIFVSSGTGTTALYLARNLPGVRVFTVPCVGSRKYLMEQMQSLHGIPDNLHILEPPLKIKFAQPHRDLLEVYLGLQKNGLEIDLIYDAAAWLCIKQNLPVFQNKNLLFVHSGGIHGNESQLKRYRQLYASAFA